MKRKVVMVFPLYINVLEALSMYRDRVTLIRVSWKIPKQLDICIMICIYIATRVNVCVVFYTLLCYTRFVTLHRFLCDSIHVPSRFVSISLTDSYRWSLLLFPKCLIVPSPTSRILHCLDCPHPFYSDPGTIADRIGSPNWSTRTLFSNPRITYPCQQSSNNISLSVFTSNWNCQLAYEYLDGDTKFLRIPDFEASRPRKQHSPIILGNVTNKVQVLMKFSFPLMW
jgi:hypothetical protein